MLFYMIHVNRKKIHSYHVTNVRVIATNIKLMHAFCVKLCEILDKVSPLKLTSRVNVVNDIGCIKCDCYNVSFQVLKQFSTL